MFFATVDRPHGKNLKKNDLYRKCFFATVDRPQDEIFKEENDLY